MLRLVQNLFSPVRIVEHREPPDAEVLKAALRSGDFGAVEAALSDRKDADLRMWRLEALGRDLRLRPAIAKWRAIGGISGSHNAAVVAGYSGVNYAWVVRGTGWEPQNYGEFQRRLGEAQALLESCCSTDPKDPAPWNMLLAVARGRQLGVDETMRIFKEGWRRSGPSRMIGLAAIQSFASKWGAPQGTLESVVKSMLATAPAGHRAHTLAVEAAAELVVDRCRAMNRFEPGLFTMPDIAQLVSHSEQLWHKAPGHKADALDAGGHSTLAFAHWCAGNHTLAEPHLRAIYPVFDETPWAYAGDPAAAARRAAKECGL